jgi:hypothetical protein
MSRPSPVASYVPAPGSHAAQGLAHLKAAHPALVSGGELAELLEVDSKNVFASMRRCIEYGLVKLEKHGRWNMYGITDSEALNTAQESEASPEQLSVIAKRAVIQMRAATKSSVELAGLCSCTAQEIDTALSSLVADKKLIRVDVIRGGQPMFDYRWGSTYVPHDADFDTPGASAPQHQVSAVAEPKASATVNNPRTPWRQPGSLKLPGTPDFKPRDALAAGAELGKKEPHPADAVAKALTEKLPSTPEVFQPKVPDFRELNAETMLGWQAQADDKPEPDQFAAEDEYEPEFSITSRGQMSIFSGTDEMTLEPRHALALKRFLDNTSILEELAAGGAL